MKTLFKRKPTAADRARSKEIPAPSTYREGDRTEPKEVTITIRDSNGKLITVTGISETSHDDYSWRGR